MTIGTSRQRGGIEAARAGLTLDDRGLLLGCVPIAVREQGVRGERRYRIKPAAEIARMLRLAYDEAPDDLGVRCARRLQRVVDLLKVGDDAKAGVQVSLARFPAISPEGLGKLSAARGLRRAGDAYLTEDRIAAHETGAGEWTAGGGGSSATPGEVNPETIDDIANRDYHDQVVAKVARIARALGCSVVTEIPLTGVNGVTARADILMKTPVGQLVLIEVKTGNRPSYEDSQRVIYPMATIGEHVFSDDPRITQLGFLPLEKLPPMEFETLYKRDKKTRLQWERHGPFES